MTYQIWLCWAYWRAWSTPRQGMPRRWLAGNGWCRRGARGPPSPSVVTPFTAICIGSQLIFRPWLTLTSRSFSSPCLPDGDPAHCPCSHSDHSPTPGSPMAQSHPQQPLRPSNSHCRRWSLPLVAVAVFLFIKISVQCWRRRWDHQRRPWQRRCERQQKQQPPTSIPSHHHGHHRHEGPIPPIPRRLAIRWPPFCFF